MEYLPYYFYLQIWFLPFILLEPQYHLPVSAHVIFSCRIRVNTLTQEAVPRSAAPSICPISNL